MSTRIEQTNKLTNYTVTNTFTLVTSTRLLSIKISDSHFRNGNNDTKK